MKSRLTSLQSDPASVMPIITDRARMLKDLRGRMYVSVLLERGGPFVLDSSSSDSSEEANSSSDSSSSSDSDDEIFPKVDPLRDLCELYALADSVRYFEDRGKFLKLKEFANNFFNSLPDAYFQHVTRMDKVSFWILVGMIEEHPIFHSQSFHGQMAVSLQLAATLDRLGHHGNGAALKRSGILWGISTGSVVKFMHHCLTALEVALVDAVSWSDEGERARISGEFAKKGFPGCIGLVDGTLIPLSQRPSIDGEVYFDRKKR